MSYKTCHRLKIKQPDEGSVKRIIDISNYIDNNDDMSWVFSEGIGEWGEDDRSFENKVSNMRKLSKSFPEAIFILEYEPIDDYRIGQYTEYWFKGKVQEETAEIQVAPFDINKLK